jgi:hypothetical protein
VNRLRAVARAHPVEVAATIATVALLALGAVLVVLSGTWTSYWVQFTVQNVLPFSLWTLLAIGIAHVRIRRHVTAQHEATASHVESILSDHLEATAGMVSGHVKALTDRLEEQHLAVVKHLGKQSAHLVRQDNVMRDLKGAGK